MAEDQSVSQDTQTVTSGSDTPASSSNDTVSPESTNSEPVAEEGSEDQAEAKPEEQVETEAEENSLDQSDRAKSRQQVLANKLKDKGAEADSLRSELEAYKAEQRKPTGPNATGLPEFNQPPQGDVELTWEDYNRDVMSKADQLVRLRLGEYSRDQVRLSKFEEGVRTLESQYPELNPDSDSFDPELAKKTTKVYNEAAAKNPDLDVTAFMSSVMDIRSGGEQQGKQAASKTLAAQEAQGAVTPGGEPTSRTGSEQALIEKMRKGEITAAEFEQMQKS